MVTSADASKGSLNQRGQPGAAMHHDKWIEVPEASQWNKPKCSEIDRPLRVM